MRDCCDGGGQVIVFFPLASPFTRKKRYHGTVKEVSEWHQLAAVV
jgi:sensor domain CHASE-containing protein